MLFVAFGALALVPLLTGLDPSIALFTAGIGTQIFQLITKRSLLIFLASSFAFIATIQVGIQQFGIGATLGGLTSAGIIYIIFSGLIKFNGIEIIEKYLPPVIALPVIMVIGIKLATAAVGMIKSTNMVIVAVVLVFGIGDLSLGYCNFQLTGIGLACIIGVLLNLLLPNKNN